MGKRIISIVLTGALTLTGLTGCSVMTRSLEKAARAGDAAKEQTRTDQEFVYEESQMQDTVPSENRDSEQNIQTQEQGSGDSCHVPDYFTKKQQEEIINLYRQAREDEESALDTYINDFIVFRTSDAYDPYAESLQSLIGTTESLYEAVNEVDPNLKNELTALTEDKYGYLAGKGMQALLSDSEYGQMLRQFGEISAIYLLDGILNWARNSGPQASACDLMPCSVHGDYALMSTFGTLSEIVDEIVLTYSLGEEAINERYDALDQILLETADDDLSKELNVNVDDPESVAAVFEIYRRSQPIRARMSVLEAKLDDLEQDKNNVINVFLQSKGITGYSMDEEADDYYKDIPEMNQCLYYIMTSDGTIDYCFKGPKGLKGVISEDGTAALWTTNYESDDPNHIIIDKNGNVVYRNNVSGGYGDIESGSVIYYNVSPCGNILRQTFQSDFDHGDYSSIDLVTPDGDVIPVFDAVDYFSIEGLPADQGKGLVVYKGGVSAYSDQICVTVHNPDKQKVIINMATGELMTDDELTDQYQEFYSKIQKNFGLASTVVNDRYVLTRNEGILYDYSGNEVADFTAGEGPEDGYPYYDEETGNYWVVTRTDYLYVTDENFERILEPVKLCDNAETKFYPGYGMCVFDPQQQLMQIYNINGEVIFEIPKDRVVDNGADNNNGWPEIGTGYICGNDEAGWYNMSGDSFDIMVIPDYEGEIADLGLYDQEP